MGAAWCARCASCAFALGALARRMGIGCAETKWDGVLGVLGAGMLRKGNMTQATCCVSVQVTRS
jgi:hypothetical protein